MRIYTYKIVLVAPDKTKTFTKDKLVSALRRAYVGLMEEEDLMEVAAQSGLIEDKELDIPDAELSDPKDYDKAAYVWRREVAKVLEKAFEETV